MGKKGGSQEHEMMNEAQGHYTSQVIVRGAEKAAKKKLPISIYRKRGHAPQRPSFFPRKKWAESTCQVFGAFSA
ncbi:unnamed protein product [Caenorhabditis auriculariae]|uniref:Uncharacterized protein n=1 Tax=Caenorhabditis auriculariae TaxID=2777116 RepID=A0A8S1H0B7_9PELO|nr:unnamed protein product [Caenorhabditis auriculariae]